jgi:hypothetical protein
VAEWVQYPPFTTSGTVPASGTLTLTFRTRGNQATRATQVTAKMTGGASAICELQLNGRLISPMVPTGGAAGGLPYPSVGPGDELSLVWTGAPVGRTGEILVIYEVLQ